MKPSLNGQPSETETPNGHNLAARTQVSWRNPGNNRPGLYHALIEGSLDGIHVVDPATGRFLDANSRGYRDLGYTLEELLELTVFDVAVGVDREFFDAAGARLRKTGQTTLEVTHRRKDGTTFPTELSLSLITLDQPYILGVMRDITERKRAEARVASLAAIVDSSPDAIISTNLDGNIQTWNAASGRLFGYAAEEVAGRNTALLIPAVHRVEEAALMEQVRKGESVEICETIRLRKDGAPVQVSLTISPVRDAAGRIVGASERMRDTSQLKRAEAQLRASEEKFRSLFENSRDALMTVDAATGKFTSGNPAALKMFGAGSEAEFITHAPGELSPERQADGRASAEQAGEMMKLALQTGSSCFEWTHRRISGEEFVAEVLLTPLCEGETQKLQATVRDITERKRTERALAESEAQFRATFELAAIGMAQVGLDGRLLRVNQRFCAILGYQADELCQRTIRDISHPDDWEASLARMSRTLAGEMDNYVLEKRYLRKNLSVVPVNLTVSLLREASGMPKHFIAVVEDVTGRKRAEEANARLAMAVEQASETIVITDTRATIVYANPAFEDSTGYTRAEAVGRNPRFLKSGRQDASFYRQMWETLGRGEVWHGHFVNRRKNGALYEEEATISPVRDAAGKTINYVAVKRDVTREVQLQAQLRQSQKMEAIGQLSGGVAHDFNNILAAMLMQTELAEAVAHLPPEALKLIRDLRASTERAANLTRQLLLFSRREVMQPCILDLNQCVTSLARMLRRIIGEDVRLQLNLSAAPLLTRADAGMLDQVLMNLCVNARDAMPQGGRLLIETAGKTVDENLAQLNADARPGGHVCLTVSDTGCGIPPEVLPRIFEPFFTTKEPGKGTGLGLATVFGIIKQHQGWINVFSKPGEGATFEIFLPVCAVTAADTPQNAGRRPARGGTETILLVEDEWAVRSLTRVILTRRGYKVLEAPNGVQALKVWQEHRTEVALLLTDLVMPAGLNGQELARQLHADQPQLKVVFISGYSGELAGQELRLHPGEKFLQKPCPPDQILATVRECLDERALEQPRDPLPAAVAAE